jgi:molybdenum cofactor biosynthesis enzyme MoaA
VDVRLGFRCNHGCRFCSQQERRAEEAPGLDLVVAELTRVRGLTRHVVLTGGEPTIHPHFLTIVDRAHTLGFARVEVETNGAMLAYRTFVRALAAYRRLRFRVAIHGATAAQADWHTQVPGSFERALTAMQALAAQGVPFGLSTVVTRSNFRELPRLAEVALTTAARDWRLRLPVAEGAAAESYPYIAPRLELAAPHMARAAQMLRARGRQVFLVGVPPCVVASPLDEREDGARLPGFTTGPPCGTCVLEPRCPGVHVEYTARFGWDEVKPLAQARLRPSL